MRRIGVRVSRFRNFIIHQIFSELLQPLRDFRTQRVFPFLQPRVFPFFLVLFSIVFGVLLAWSTSGLPDLSSTVVDTVTGEGSLSIRSSRSRVLVSLTVGDEGESEEDVEQWLSWLESVFEVDEDPEDELDKPGTTTGTKFSVLHGIFIPFLMRCGFWPLIHS